MKWTMSFFVCVVVWTAQLVPQESSKDEMLQAKVRERIHELILYGVNDYINADVENGTLTLTGWVRFPWLAEKAVSYAGNIEGITAIDNRLQVVLGSSELAAGAARAIYRDDVFYKYRFESELPVHVIAVNNSLILAGQVQTELERERAAFIADAFSNVIAVENQLQIKQR